jgi:pimeloyl-ACP methyl ester carboxylesterase
VAIPTASGETLSGWLISNDAPKGVIMLLHPQGGNRDSMLTRAEIMWRAGYTVLLFDFRGHGASPGLHSTFGFEEGKDARDAMRWVKAHFPNQPVGVIGWSLGGAAALLGDTPLGANALVLEAVYPTIEDATYNRLHVRLGRLAGIARAMLLVQLKPRLGISPTQLRPIDHIAEVGAPVLVLAGAKDRYTPLEESRRLFEHALVPKEFWVVPGAGHVDFCYSARHEYELRVLDFFQRYMTATRPPA